MSTSVETIKRRLKRKEAWQFNFLDELVTSTMRTMGNHLANKGPRAQCEFLLEHGWTIDEIVKEGRRVRRLIRKHNAGFMSTSSGKILGPKSKHKHKEKV